MGNLASNIYESWPTGSEDGGSSNPTSQARNTRSRGLISNHYRYIYEYLITGSTLSGHRRSALPVEIALYILRLAECTVSFIVRTDEPFDVTSSGMLERRLWFTTPPIGQSLLKNIAAVTLVTKSRHQGWVSLPDQGSWSWWEVAVVRGSSKEALEKEGKLCFSLRDSGRVNASDLGFQDADHSGLDEKSGDKRRAVPLRSFVSHRHDVHMPLSEGDRIFTGRRFTRDHELFYGYDPVWMDTSFNTIVVTDGGVSEGPMQEGDRLAVFGCAQYPGWACHGSFGELRVEVYWEPEEIKRADEETAEDANAAI